jgi:hypothetical protein
MKGKTKLLTNFKWIFKMSIRTVEMLQKEIQSLCNFVFLKIAKIEPANKFQSFFSKWNAFFACNTSLFISFTLLIRMKWTKASLVGMDLSNMAQFSGKNIWRSFLCSLHCPQMKRIPLITIEREKKMLVLRPTWMKSLLGVVLLGGPPGPK